MKLLFWIWCLVIGISPLIAGDNLALINQGKATFEQHCARCHGPEGKGNGPDAKRIPIVPRDLTEGTFKFQSTAQGTPPSDDDLMWILNHGMTGAGMPSFGNLNVNTKTGLVAYVKTLSHAFETKPEPLALPNIKARVDLKQGKELFTKLQCALCHGEGGKANGTSAFTLKDKWERPIKPADLTQGWTYRAGDSAAQIYYRLMAGINGAPMPSYAEAVKPEEAWQLAKYVESLQMKPRWKSSVDVQEVKGDLPQNASDALWNSAPRTEVNLQGNFYANGRKEFSSIHEISIQALANDQGISFRLSWHDPTEDGSLNSPNTLAHGSQGKADALLLALCPKNFKSNGTRNLHNLYFTGADPLDLYLWSAGSPTVVRETVSSADSALRPGARFSNELKSSANYQDGAWTLVFMRPRKLNGADTLDEHDKSIRIGFAAWNASNNESGLNRSTSQWISLVLKKDQPHH